MVFRSDSSPCYSIFFLVNDTVTGKNVIIPDSTVFLEPITSYTYDVPHIWLSVPIDITYESDMALAEKKIFNVAKDVAGE